MNEPITIENYGRGPQLSTSRLTVMDVFYYTHRGHDFDFIHRAMPKLSRPEFDVVMEYIRAHHDELVESDQRVEEAIQRGIAEQRAKGWYHDRDDDVPVEVRVARLKAKLAQRLAEKNGAQASH